MTRVLTAHLEKESNWMRLINLEGDTSFIFQNQSAVKGQRFGLCPEVFVFSRGVIFTRAHDSLSVIPERK